MAEKNQKTIDEYRKNIFTLKSKIKEQQKIIETLKQQFSSYNVLQQVSYQFKLKSKLIQTQIAQLNNKQRKYMKHQAHNVYSLYFAVLKLLKSCDILNITPEMVFRGADKKMEKIVGSGEFSNYLSQIFMLPQNSINMLIQCLDNKKGEGKIRLETFDYLLECFLIKKQEKKEKESIIQIAYTKLIDLLLANKIIVESFWKDDKLDIGQFSIQILKQLKQMTILQCIAIFSRFDPIKQGFIIQKELIYNLKQKMQERNKNKKIVLKK